MEPEPSLLPPGIAVPKARMASPAPIIEARLPGSLRNLEGAAGCSPEPVR